MGYWKNYAEHILERGYEDSDKSICSSCVGDKYFSKLIKTTGTKSLCSFCRKRRNVLPVNDILEAISTVVTRDYLPANGNAIFDPEEHKWWESDEVMDPYDFVYNELNQYLESDNDEFLQELIDKLTFEDRMSVFKVSSRPEEIAMEEWNEYCGLVRSTPLSAEQIVGLIKSGNNKRLPEELKRISDVLEMVHEYSEELGLIKYVNGMDSKKGATDIYRCVNYLDWNQSYAGLEFTPATLVGTAPARIVQDGRMSEKGDMMFYGADSKETAMMEVGENEYHRFNPATIGTFHCNKQFRILYLAELDYEKLPSIFDLKTEQVQKRSYWYFLNEFMERISEKKPEEGFGKTEKMDDATFYKPTQVFTKFIQRNTDLSGIRYRSSKCKGNCYVLFVVNRDCLDVGDKIDGGRKQLIMEKVEQIAF